MNLDLAPGRARDQAWPAVGLTTGLEDYTLPIGSPLARVRGRNRKREGLATKKEKESRETTFLNSAAPLSQLGGSGGGLPNGNLDVGQVLGGVYLSPLDEGHPAFPTFF